MLNKLLCLNKLALKLFNRDRENAEITGSTLPARVFCQEVVEVHFLIGWEQLTSDDMTEAQAKKVYYYVFAQNLTQNVLKTLCR